MTATIDELIARKSVRMFEPTAIPAEAREQILLAAVNAPTAGNQQLYTILDITDQTLKEALAESCDHQPFIAGAKLVLVFCADCRKWLQAYTLAGADPRAPGVGDLMLAVTDTAIAAQNAVTAAWSLGIGSCYIGDIMENCDRQRELLHLPEYVFPCCMLVFGYPTPQQQQRKKPQRVALEHIVHENTYHDYSPDGLRAMFAPATASTGFDAWMHAFCARKYNSDFSREMTRSVAQYLQAYTPKQEE